MRSPAPAGRATLVAVAFALALTFALTPAARAAICLGGACVADEPYRDPDPGCNGTRWLTGAWFASPDLYVYAFGERHDCRNGWSGMGGSGVRVGVFVVGYDAEVRWYERASGGCEAGAFSMGFHAAGPCVARPPAIPWGNALP